MPVNCFASIPKFSAIISISWIASLFSFVEYFSSISLEKTLINNYILKKQMPV
ncbi:hypothetical protein Scep_002599 [Stephania cephalantha]|uniref:Uncharacterized protein n=1 Tax=Stephania cephalantha TaxID=152367 RepID=A0AAP0Q546_9MAGN